MGVASAASFAGSYGGLTSQGSPLTLQVSKDGRQVTVTGTAVEIKCSDGSIDYLSDGWRKLAVSAKGAFAGKFTDVPGETEDGRKTSISGSISGRVNAKRRTVSGRWNLAWTVAQPDGSTISCRSGAITFKAGGFASGRPKARGWFGAFSSAGYPVVLEVDKEGRQVKGIGGLFWLKCSKGGARLVTDFWNELPLAASGKFEASVDNLAQKFSDGSSYTLTATVSGKIDRSGHNLTGRWRVTWKVPEADGSTDVCDSGPISFKVRR